jgi:hypothetical protein
MLLAIRARKPASLITTSLLSTLSYAAPSKIKSSTITTSTLTRILILPSKVLIGLF